MAYRNLANINNRFMGPTAPRKRFGLPHEPQLSDQSSGSDTGSLHPLTNEVANGLQTSFAALMAIAIASRIV